jgi:chromosome segregation ATPase
MSDKKFLSWVGFKNTETKSGSITDAPESTLDRIRQLEAQLADLRSRRDITSLTKEEFEILATETAMNLIKTAQSREAKAAAIASKTMNDATRSASTAISEAQSKVKELLGGAESRARKVLSAAEAEAQERFAKAQASIESLSESKRREAAATTLAAKREAERMMQEATAEISNFRGWLTTAISESERLHRVQVQSLSAAEEAIKQTRSRLSEAFERLEKLGTQISANLTSENRPTTPAFSRAVATVRQNATAIATQEADEIGIAIPEVPGSFTPQPSQSRTVKKAKVKKPVAKIAPAKKATSKKAVAKKPVAKKSAPAARKGQQTKRK